MNSIPSFFPCQSSLWQHQQNVSSAVCKVALGILGLAGLSVAFLGVASYLPTPATIAGFSTFGAASVILFANYLSSRSTKLTKEEINLLPVETVIKAHGNRLSFEEKLLILDAFYESVQGKEDLVSRIEMRNTIADKFINKKDLTQVDQDGRSLLQITYLRRDYDLAQKLLEKGADPCVTDHHGQNIFHLATRLFSGNAIKVPQHALPSIRMDDLGDDEIEFLKTCLAKGLDPLSLDNAGDTFFSIVAKYPILHIDAPTLIKLSGNSAFLYVKDQAGKTPLHYAMQFGKITLAHALMKLINKNRVPKEFKWADHDGNSPLHLLCTQRSDILNEAEAFVRQTGDFNILKHQNNKGQTCLHILSGRNDNPHAESIAYLISKSKELSAFSTRDHSGLSPIEIAFSGKDKKLREIYYANLRNEELATLYPFAIEHALHVPLLELTLRKVPLKSLHHTENEILRKAVASGDLVIVGTLLHVSLLDVELVFDNIMQTRAEQVGIKEELFKICEKKEGRIIFQNLKGVIEKGNVDGLQFYKKAGIDFKNWKDQGNSALHLAAAFCQPTCIALLAKECDLSQVNEQGYMPIHMVGFNKKEDEKTKETIETLIAHGASIEYEYVCKYDPLWVYAFTNNISAVKAILKYASNMEHIESAPSPFHIAVIKGFTEVANLLRNHVNINRPYLYGRTPLHLAILYGQINLAISLIEWGADVTVLDAFGKRYWHYFKNQYEINNFLIELQSRDLTDAPKQVKRSEFPENFLGTKLPTPILKTVLGFLPSRDKKQIALLNKSYYHFINSKHFQPKFSQKFNPDDLPRYMDLLHAKFKKLKTLTIEKDKFDLPTLIRTSVLGILDNHNALSIDFTKRIYRLEHEVVYQHTPTHEAVLDNLKELARSATSLASLLEGQLEVINQALLDMEHGKKLELQKPITLDPVPDTIQKEILDLVNTLDGSLTSAEVHESTEKIMQKIKDRFNTLYSALKLLAD